MATPEVTTIAILASQATELEELVQLISQAGTWGLVPIEWPDASALVHVRGSARAYFLHSGSGTEGPSSELVSLLGSRPEGTALIVVGSEPARAASPDLWLPTNPTPSMLATIISHLLGNQESVKPAGPAWRRKTDMLIGNSPAMQQLLHSLDHLAPSQTPVIITGESGVGKELVARALHFCGPRAKEPFIAINCAAIPENLFEAELFGYQRGAFTGAVHAHAGAFEAANKGTLFLDEIGEMPLGMQAKLLRVLETSEVQRIGSTAPTQVDFRLVTATNRKLEKEIKEGRFREDLYYRIQVYPLHITPLRERPEDIPPIVTHHLSMIGAREKRPALRLTSSALEKLLAHAWPGNVRELVNLLERGALLSGESVIDAEHIVLQRRAQSVPPEPLSLVPYREAKTRFELEYYSQLMRTSAGNVSLAAKLGQKTRKEVYDALKRLGLDAAEYRTED